MDSKPLLVLESVINLMSYVAAVVTTHISHHELYLLFTPMTLHTPMPWTIIHTNRNTVQHSYNKPEIPGQTVSHKQEFVASGQFPKAMTSAMYYSAFCSTWLRPLLCYIKVFVIEEFVIRVFHCRRIGSNYVRISLLEHNSEYLL